MKRTRLYLIIKLNCHEKTVQFSQLLGVEPTANILVFVKNYKNEKEILNKLSSLFKILTDEYCFILQYSLKILDDRFCNESIITYMEEFSKTLPCTNCSVSTDGTTVEVSYDYRTLPKN